MALRPQALREKGGGRSPVRKPVVSGATLSAAGWF